MPQSVDGQNKRRVLYDAVSQEYNLGTWEQFNTKLDDPSKRRALYDAVGVEYNLGEFSEFEAKVYRKPEEGIEGSIREAALPFTPRIGRAMVETGYNIASGVKGTQAAGRGFVATLATMARQQGMGAAALADYPDVMEEFAGQDVRDPQVIQDIQKSISLQGGDPTKERLTPGGEENQAAQIKNVKQAIDLRFRGAKWTEGMNKRYEGIKDFESALDFIYYGIGQGIGQIPLAVATGGLSVIPQEVGSIYVEQVERIAEDNGISVDEVIKRGMDEEVYAFAYGLAASSLEVLGAHGVMSAFGKKAIKKSLMSQGKKRLLNKTVKGVAATGTEAVTEAGQTVLEIAGREGISSMEVMKLAANPEHEFHSEILNAAALGAIGGGALHTMGSIINRDPDFLPDEVSPEIEAKSQESMEKTGKVDLTGEVLNMNQIEKDFMDGLEQTQAQIKEHEALQRELKHEVVEDPDQVTQTEKEITPEVQKVTTPQKKTTKKAPVKKTGEELTVDELDKLPRGKTHYDVAELKESISKEGVKEPIILEYYVKDNSLVLKEGHHRLEALKQLGEKGGIPVKISVNWNDESTTHPQNIEFNKGKKFTPPKPLDVAGYEARNYQPSNIELSELGFGEIKKTPVTKKTGKTTPKTTKAPKVKLTPQQNKKQKSILKQIDNNANTKKTGVTKGLKGLQNIIDRYGKQFPEAAKKAQEAIDKINKSKEEKTAKRTAKETEKVAKRTAKKAKLKVPTRVETLWNAMKDKVTGLDVHDMIVSKIDKRKLLTDPLTAKEKRQLRLKARRHLKFRSSKNIPETARKKVVESLKKKNHPDHLIYLGEVNKALNDKHTDQELDNMEARLTELQKKSMLAGDVGILESDEVEMLRFALIDNRPKAEQEAVYEDLLHALETGKTKRQEFLAARREKATELRERLIPLALGATPEELVNDYEDYISKTARTEVLNMTGQKEWDGTTTIKFVKEYNKFKETDKAPTPEMEEVFKGFNKWIAGSLNNKDGKRWEQLQKKHKLKRSIVNRYTLLHDTFSNLMDYVGVSDKGARVRGTQFNKEFSDMERLARQNEIGGQQKWNGKIMTKFREIFFPENMKDYKLTNKINKFRAATGTLTAEERGRLVAGEIVDDLHRKEHFLIKNELEKASLDQVMNVWLGLQNDSVRESLVDKYGEEVEENANRIMDENPQVKEMAEWLLNDFYPEYYDELNAAYMEKTGMSLVRTENYTPLIRAFKEDDVEGIDKSFKDFYPIISTLNSFMKPRVAKTSSKHDIDLTAGALKTLERYVIANEHFKAYDGFITKASGFFNNTDVKNVLEVRFGKDINRIVKDKLDHLTHGRIIHSFSEHWVDKVRSNIIVQAIGFIPNLLLKQMTSFVGYTVEMPVMPKGVGRTYAGYMSEYLSMPKGKQRTIGNTLMTPVFRGQELFDNNPVLQERLKRGSRSLDETILHIRSSRFLFGERVGNRALADYTMSFIRMGDMGAILLGGYPVYRAHYDLAIHEGKTKEEAAEIASTKFMDVTLNTQQSGEIADMPAIKNNAFGRVISSFLTTPMQYGSNVRAGLRAMRRNGLNTKAGRNGFSKAVMYGVLLPSLFQTASQGFRFADDDEDDVLKKRLFYASIDNFFNSLGYFGWAAEESGRALYEGLYDTAVLGKEFELKPKFFQSGIILDEVSKTLVEAFKQISKFGQDGELTRELVAAVLAPIGIKMGLPLSNMLKFTLNTQDVLNDEADFSKMLLYSDWALNKSDEKRKYDGRIPDIRMKKKNLREKPKRKPRLR